MQGQAPAEARKVVAIGESRETWTEPLQGDPARTSSRTQRDASSISASLTRFGSNTATAWLQAVDSLRTALAA